MSEVEIKLPKKLVPIFLGEADVRGAHGGRGSGKTRSFAKMVAVRGYMYGNMGIKGQLLCARQFMNSLEDSSLEECKRAIEEEPFLLAYYEIGDRYIKSRDGNIQFSFAGLDRNIGSIKSKGRILLCWVDEAEPVTEHAFSILIPTLREEGEGWNAELWLTWNPERKSSAVNKRFRKSEDPRVKIVELNWRDNPWFPQTLNRTRLKDQEERPDTYDHIWEGAYGNVQGAILGSRVAKARREGRINSGVRFDQNGSNIVITSDLGFRDTASWWYWQPVLGGFNLLKYEGASGMDADDWIPKIMENLIEIGCGRYHIWLPHDARAKTFQSRHTTIEKFVSAFGHGKVSIVPMTKKSDQISAARTVIDSCAFNEDKCEEGLDGLEAWEFEYNEDTESFSKEPKHNWASHPSDAFAYGAVVMREVQIPVKEKEPTFPAKGINGRIVTAPLNDLWNTPQKRNNRI